MSRLPPMIEQVINGEKVKGYAPIPILSNDVVFSVDMQTIPDEQGHLYKQEISLEAKKKTGEVIWNTVVYSNLFDRRLETDVQERYPVDLYFDTNGTDVTVKLEHYSDTEGIFSCNKETGKLVYFELPNNKPKTHLIKDSSIF